MTVSIKLPFYEPMNAIEMWRTSGDTILMGLADHLEEFKELPTEEEMVEILTFFSIFSMGCGEMGIKELATEFERKANLLIVGLRKIGLISGKYKSYVLNRMSDGYASRVISKSASRAAYRMCDLSRNIKEPKIPSPPKTKRTKKTVV